MCMCDIVTGVLCGYHLEYLSTAEKNKFYKEHINYLKTVINVSEGHCQHSL